MRIEQVDFLRGIGILLVIFYHFLFSLHFFGVSDINPHKGWPFFVGRLAVITMIFVVGMSLQLSYFKASKTKDFFSLIKKYFFRSLKLFLIALLISFVSYVFYPEGWVRWGIIHFIALAVFVCSFFARFYYFNLFAAIFSFLLSFIINSIPTDNFLLFIIGFHMDIYTLDYVSFFPWASLVFLGMFFANSLYIKNEELAKIKFSDFLQSKSKIVGKLYYYILLAGKNSLLLYLLHIPIIVGGLFFLKKIL